MTSWGPYLWKECRQNLKLALGSLAIFLGIGLMPPLLEHLLQGRRHYDNDAILAVIQLGGPFLALWAGVYATSREQGPMERFWRSRPLDLKRWLAGKYIVGLALVWSVCWIPLAIYMLLVKTVSNADMALAGTARAILAHSFVLMLVYSAAFALGQSVRGTLNAAILAAGAMALIYIVPLVVAPLSWLSLETVRRAQYNELSLASYLAFAASLTAAGMALVGLAGVFLRRNARFEVDRRVLSWSVVVILLVLAAGVAFPMGTNLPAQQIIALPALENIMCHDLAAHGNDVLILVSTGPESGSGRGRKCGLVKAHIGQQTSIVGEPLWLTDPRQQQNLGSSAYGLAWPAAEPSLAYVLLRQSQRQGQTVVERTLVLYTIALGTDRSDPIVHRLALDPLFGSDTAFARMALHGQHLYIYEESPDFRLLTFSLADPGSPALVDNQDLPRRIGYDAPRLYRDSGQQYRVRLAPIPDANESIRIEITSDLAPDYWAPAGSERIVASARDPGTLGTKLILAEAGPMQDDVLPLQPNTQRQVGTFERFLGSSLTAHLFCSNDLAFRLNGAFGVTVYDIRRPGRTERTGHYAAGEAFSTMAVLGDNRVVIAGDRLHVLDLSEQASAPSIR